MQRKNNIRKLLTLFLLLPLFGTGNAFAQELNMKEYIFGHIGDSYGWHITKWGEKELFIPLPVIIKGQQSGWHFFLSTHLEHGAQYEGFHIAHEGKHTGKIVEQDSTGEEIRPILDISITKNAAALMISCLILLSIIIPLANRYKRGNMKPAKGFMGVVEIVLINIQDDVIKACLKEDYRRFSPYILTIFFFILINNLLGLIPFFPGGANITGNIAVTAVLAICTFFAVNFYGNKHYWKEIFWPDVPIWLKFPAPIIPVIEFFGVFTKPFALAIRLFANITAGHSVILGFIGLIFISVSMGTVINAGMSTVAILFACFMFVIELLIAYIQAYVFTLLSAVFISLARTNHKAHTN